MNEIKNLNIKLSVNNSLPNLKNFIKNGEMDFSIENMLKVKDLVAKKNLSRKKATKFTPLIIKLTKTKIFKKRFCNKKIPSFLSGIFLKLAGKVLTKKIQRRVKSKVIQKGSLARANTELINTKTFVKKNKRGVFSITIKTGHIVSN